MTYIFYKVFLSTVWKLSCDGEQEWDLRDLVGEYCSELEGGGSDLEQVGGRDECCPLRPNWR